jgi:hypothetical protein
MKIIINESQLKKVIDSELGERSRSFAFTRKKRKFPKVAMKYSGNRFKEYDKEINDIKEDELTEKCWDGYEKKGMKTMFGKRYPNCVKKK